MLVLSNATKVRLSGLTALLSACTQGAEQTSPNDLQMIWHGCMTRSIDDAPGEKYCCNTLLRSATCTLQEREERSSMPTCKVSLEIISAIGNPRASQCDIPGNHRKVPWLSYYLPEGT